MEERERIYKVRSEELQREITIAIEASERGEVVDGEIVFAELEEDIREIEMEMQQALKPDRKSVPFYNSCKS